VDAQIIVSAYNYPEKAKGYTNMPIRHTDKGWYWGGQGPFDTKAKALAVSRAAHASGYKEQTTEAIIMVEQCISRLLHAVTLTHMYHLKSRSFSQHMALGSFYEGLDDLVDSLIEAYQGKYGLIEDYETDAGEMPPSPLEYLIALNEYVAQSRTEFPQDSELQNIIDEIVALIDSTLYKLRFLA
jgi:hypothetical protein